MMTITKRRKVAVLPVLAVLFLTACATVPAGPSMMVMPGTSKSFEQFQADDSICRQWAQQRTGTTPGEAATSSGVGSAIVGTVVGAGIGAAIGAASGSPATGAAVGAGAGLLGGTAVGAGNAYGAGLTVQRRYDIAYMQCMYAKGNQVPVSRAPQPAYTSTAPPPPPPPPPQWVPQPPTGSPPPRPPR